MADSGFDTASLHTQRTLSPTISEAQPQHLKLDHPFPMLSIQPTMNGPVSQRGFVATEAFKQVEQLMEDPEMNSIVVSGPSGSGKSTLTQEICVKLWNGMPEYKIFRVFNCNSLESLYRDLGLFYRDIQHRQDMLSRRPTWEILQSFYTAVNDIFPQHEKFFIFDDVENVDEMLRNLNHICRKLSGNKDQGPLWKCLVTSQKQILHPMMCGHIRKESFISIKGFNLEETKELFKHCDAEMVEFAADIRKVVGELPLALTICMTALGSDELECKARLIKNYLKAIVDETKTLDEEGLAKPKTSVLIAIKLSIERLLDELPSADESKEVLKMLSLLNQKNISTELLLACAETVTETPEKARMLIRNLTSRLIERTVCSKKIESNVRLFSLHQLVKESLKLFIGGSDFIALIQKTLVGLTRVMPKDGRKHQTRVVGFYADHGESMDQEIKKLVTLINHEDTPFILYLHCHLLVGMGYCLLAQRNELKGGIERLKQARNKYCELIHGLGYDYEKLKRDSRLTASEVDKQLAIDLYEAGQSLSMMRDPDYLKYIEELPLYHRLTTKDVANMSGVNEDELSNGHLVKLSLMQFKEKGRQEGEMRVIEVDQLKQVAVAELLAQIYCVWSKVHGKRDEYKSQNEECIHQAEAAVEVYNRIFSNSKIYLLSALITEREMLTLKLGVADNVDEVNRISQQFAELSVVGTNPDKRLAYEAGLMRSNLSNDHYHRLLCKEAEINCQGRLYQLGGGDRCYMRGKELLTEVEELARKQVYKHSARSFSYKSFASFLCHCERYGDAMIYIIKAMQELHEHVKEDQRSSDSINSSSSSNGSGDGSHPELDHPRFKALYSNLRPYFEKYLNAKKRSNEKLLDGTRDEAKYLQSALAVWRDMGGGDQPSDANSKFAALENIVENEIRHETAVASTEDNAQFP